MKPQEARKKPVKIKYLIFKYSEEGIKELQKFVGKNLGVISKSRNPNAKAEAEIVTLEDGFDGRVKHIATEGDYIVKGIKGEFYPIKPDIFKDTYNEVGVLDGYDEFEKMEEGILINIKSKNINFLKVREFIEEKFKDLKMSSYSTESNMIENSQELLFYKVKK